MPDLEAMAAGIQVLGDATRLRILLMLAEGEMNVSAICDRLGAVQPTTSHHLGLLTMVGWVQPRRQGQKIFYSLTEAPPRTQMIAVTAAGAAVRVERG